MPKKSDEQTDEKRAADEQTDAMLESPKVFNANTAQWEAPGPEDAYRVEEHEAQVKGEPAPGDRSELDMRRLESQGGGVPVGGPVVTAASPNEPAGTGATGNATGNERTTATGNTTV